MREFITKWRRDRAVSQVVRLGKEIRTVEATLAEFPPELAQTYERLCAELAYLNRRRAKLIDYLKSTA